MECLVLFYIESMLPPIWIIPAQFTFKIHATFTFNVISPSIFRLSYIIFYFVHCVILSLKFFCIHFVIHEMFCRPMGNTLTAKAYWWHSDIKNQTFYSCSSYFGDKSKTTINKLRFASIQFMRFNDKLKVVK